MTKNLKFTGLTQDSLSIQIRLPIILLILLVLIFGITLFLTELKDGLLQTTLLFVLITICGLWLAYNTAIKLGDLKLLKLSSFWMIKILATLAFLYLGWMPSLEMGSSVEGFDPLRYYYLSQEILENDWNFDTLKVSSSKVGIVYFYAASFYIFGINPFVPALINTFVTFLCIIYIIHAAYAFVPDLNQKCHYISWLIFIPEVLWYDVMTSRENLMAVLLVFAILGSGSMITSVKKINVSGLAISLLAVYGIISIRTTMVLAVVLSIIILALLNRSKGNLGFFIKFGLVSLSLFVLFDVDVFETVAGSSSINFFNKFSQISDFKNNIASTDRMGWSDKSIGLLLVPNNFLEVLAFLPFKMIMYLSSPLPNIAVSVSGLIAGDHSQWLRLFTLSTSVLILLCFPYVLAASSFAWRNRVQFPALLIIPIAFWVTFAAVAGGNIIIVERYRLMCSLLLFTCIWLGYSQSRFSSIVNWAIVWYFILTFSVFFYFVFKYI